METLTIYPEKCTACRACELACSFKKEGSYVPSLARIQIVRYMERGVNVPMVCLNCAKAACVESCPTGAVIIDRDVPTVRVDEEKCTGCGECVRACLFGAVDLHPVKGTAYMCDLCEGEPACVEHCMTGAIKFRPAQSLTQQKRRLAAEPIALETQVRKGGRL